MELFWYGQAFFKIKGKNTSVIVDPFEDTFTGLKLPKDLSANIALKTHDHQDHNNLKAITGDPILITGPGEYEISGVSIVGISMFHDDTEGKERGKNTVYNIQIDGVNIVHLGDIGHTFTESQVEEIGTCDILLIPVGSVYTIDAKQASEIVSQLEPKIIIPMHYGIENLKFPLEKVDLFLKEMGAEAVEAQPKLTISKDKLPEEPQVVVLTKS